MSMRLVSLENEGQSIDSIINQAINAPSAGLNTYISEYCTYIQ